MFAQATRHTICALALLGLAVSAATADPPTKQEVVYKIHDDPNDPNSTVVFTVWLTLAPKARDGDSIGWEVEQIRFRQVGEGGGSDTTWTESNPAVTTADGRWWIEHADPDHPQLAEFDDPPRFQGAATADDPSDDDLEYDFQGVNNASIEPWNPTGWLDYEFALVGASEPLLSGTDDPVEVANEGDPDE